MNWADIAVIAVILCFAIFGVVNGFLLAAFRIASFFISIFLAVKLYPVFSGLLQKTFLYTDIKASIMGNLAKQVPGAGGQVKRLAADSVLSSMKLPDFMKDIVRNSIVDKIDPSKLVDTTKVLDAISGALARIVVDVISLILLYILIRLALIFFRFILRGLTKLPLFKQIDKLGGFVLGTLEGLLVVYIICAVIVLFQASPAFRHIYDLISRSLIARFFFENNFIIKWMFPHNMIV